MKITKVIMAMLVLGLLFAPASPILAETSTSTNSDLIGDIQDLLKQIKTLQDQLAELEKKQGDVRQDLTDALQLTRTLSLGMSGEDVKDLQAILATDPDIYPEGLITGFFGPLTEKALKKFQGKFGLDQAGVVGPKTKAKLNNILAEGAGNSGKVPPGLLVAPGIAKKYGSNLSPLPGQILPPGIAKKLNSATSTDDDDDDEDEDDTTKPVISNIDHDNLATSSTRIEWDTNEETTGKVKFSTDGSVNESASTTQTVSSNKVDDDHEVTLSGLLADTLYYFFIEAKDDAGNIATSSIQSFTTIEE